MSEQNTNILLKVQNITKEVIREAGLLKTPKFMEVIRTCIIIIFICILLSIYFIIIGEIIVKLISIFGI